MSCWKRKIFPLNNSKKKKNWSEINNFPNDALFIVFTFLNFRELLNIKFVCKDWKRISKNEQLWKMIFERIEHWFNNTNFCPSSSTNYKIVTNFLKRKVCNIQHIENGYIGICHICLKKCCIKCYSYGGKCYKCCYGNIKVKCNMCNSLCYKNETIKCDYSYKRFCSNCIQNKQKLCCLIF